MDGNGELANLARDWRPPGELSGSPPRAVRASAKGIALTILAIGMVGGGLALGAKLAQVSARQAEIARLLTEQGAETEATVTRLWRGGGKDRPYRVSYRFQSQGLVFDGESGASRELWERLSEGSGLRVRYASSDPAVNRPSEWEPQTAPAWLAWAVPASFAVVALIMLWALRRQKRLLEDGRAAPGVITRSRRTKGGRSIRYDFLLPGGSQARGSGLVRRGLVDVGSVVTIVYNPDDPGRNAPYPFELVRPGQ